MPPETYVERDADEIAAEAYAELEAEEKGIDLNSDDLSKPEKEDEKEEQTGEAENQDAEEDSKDGETEEEDAGEDQDAEKEVEKPEEESTEESAEDLDKKITEHAEKHRFTYAEAKEDLEKTEEIIKQFKNDPVEMARAMRNKDREYSKLRSEVDKKQVEPVFQRMNEDQFKNFAKKQLAEKPEFIEKYREKYPAKSEMMSDDAIAEEVIDREFMIYNEKADKKESEIRVTASKKRDEIISQISESDRRFIPEVKAILLEADDRAIMSDSFDIKDALYWAKGKSYDADIKAAEERGAKRAKESPKIIGTKGSGTAKPVVDDKHFGLTEKQKERAVEMFGFDYAEDKCYEMFKDSYKNELKENKNFDPYK